MSTSLANLCTPSTFGALSLFGIQTISVRTTIQSINTTIPTWTFSQPRRQVQATFCNVTVSYTHPRQDDLISVEAWLPGPDDWNSMLMGIGGAGLSLGRNQASYGFFMTPPISDGYAVVATDAGVGGMLGGTLGDWAFLSPGNSDQIKLHNGAARSLEEQGLLGKQIVQSMYGRAPKYSYFNSCSQGGRQALMISQRYPDLYNGILANAPAISLEVLSSIYAPQQFMVNVGNAPRECELIAITNDAIAFCDDLDGIKDGIIAEPAACLEKYDPNSIVGKTVPCKDAPGGEIAVSATAAGVVNASWHGVIFSANGKQAWPGFRPGADLTGSGPRQTQSGSAVANTDCSSGTCVGKPWPLVQVALRTLLARDLDLNLANMTNAQFEGFVRYGRHELKAWAATDPDLTDFQRAGGKMLTYHGMADNIIPPEGTSRYYRQVSAVSPDVHSFYRLFEVPGLSHCFGGEGAPPTGLLGQLRAWVENGTAPASTPHEVLNTVTGQVQHRLVCPFPQKPVFDKGCGDVGLEKCWSCPESGY